MLENLTDIETPTFIIDLHIVRNGAKSYYVESEAIKSLDNILMKDLFKY